MKKAIVGLVAVGAVIALRPLLRRMGHKMREHCEQMAAQFGGHAEMAHKMAECCKGMSAQSESRGEATQEMCERGEQVAA
jgi:hypothetical protein